MKTISVCTVCQSSVLHPLLEVTDSFLTGETFTILQCSQCGCSMTNPQPGRNELQRYYRSESYISHSASSKGIVNKLYLTLRKYTIHKKYKLIRALTNRSSGSILDVGCGSGEFLAYFKKHNWTVMGIEPDEPTRLSAMNKYHLQIGGKESLMDIKNTTFPIITLWHSLEHMVDITETLDHLRRILTPDGVLVIAVPNHDSWDAHCYGSSWAAWDVPRHLYHFTPRSIDMLMTNHRLRVIRRIPMKMDAYYICMLSEKYRSGKVNYLRALHNGWRSNQYARTHKNTSSSMIYVMNQENA